MDSNVYFASCDSSLNAETAGLLKVNIDEDTNVSKIGRSDKSAKKVWYPASEQDSFFTRIYDYHQGKGFASMVIQDVLPIILSWFVITFCIFISVGIDYKILYQEGSNSSLYDAILPWNEARQNFSSLFIFFILLISVYPAYQSYKTLTNISKYKETRAFYKDELEIEWDDIQNVTWPEIQHKLTKIFQISELDICHRILRIKNFMITMINKSILPTKFNFPVIGENVFFTTGLRLNYELIFFTGPGALFPDIEKMKWNCRSVAGRSEVQAVLSNRILLIGVLNFVLTPVILIWTIMYFCFENYALFKHDPKMVGSRTWSIYGRHYLRHYNELDHDFNARLNKGYRAGVRYLQQFASPILTSVAKFVIALSGFVLFVMFVDTLIGYDTSVKEMIGWIITLGIVAAAKSLIPDENMIMMPGTIMSCIVYYIHYIPESWIGQAHTNRVAKEFGQLLPYRIVYLLCEILSPFFTPFVLLFWLRPRSARIVEFFRTNSPCIGSLGNVCMPSNMDLMMMEKNPDEDGQEENQEVKKVEQSLLQFSCKNPGWKANEYQEHVLSQLKTRTPKPDKKNIDLFKHAGPAFLSTNFIDEYPEYASMTMSQFHLNGDDKIENEVIRHSTPEKTLKMQRVCHMGIDKQIENEEKGTSSHSICHYSNSITEQTYKQKENVDEEEQARLISYFQKRSEELKKTEKNLINDKDYSSYNLHNYSIHDV